MACALEVFEHELNESNETQFDGRRESQSLGLRPCVLTTTIRIIRDIRVRYIKHFYFLFEHEFNESNKSFWLAPLSFDKLLFVLFVLLFEQSSHQLVSNSS